MAELVAVRLLDARETIRVLDDVRGRGDAVLPLDAAAPDAVAADLVRRLRPSALVHARPDGTGPKVTRLPDGAPVPDGTAAIVATSGSTGAPRGVVLSAAALEASARASLDRLGCPKDAQWLLSLPLHHVAGLLVVERARLAGTTPDVVVPFSVPAVAASPAGWWALVPTMLHRLVETGTDLTGRTILVGGAAATPGLVDRATRTGATVHRSYGMTETCGGCVYDGVPLPGVEVDTTTDGRLRVRGPILATGERHDDGRIAPLVDPDGWLTTSDLGAVHDGVVEVHGRADAVIVTGGENVAAEAVEASLTTHPGVAGVGVVGRPDPEWGQRVVAVVVPADPSAPPTLDDLRDHVATDLGRAAAPRELVFVDDLPTTSLGKLARDDLARHLNG